SSFATGPAWRRAILYTLRLALRENERQFRELFAAAQRQAQELALLDRVRAALARELDPQTIFHTVLETITRTFGYTLVSLYWRQGDLLELQHQVGYDHVITTISIAQGVSGQVARTGMPVLIEVGTTFYFELPEWRELPRQVTK
ncbi:MAG TPA: hypothetical protein VKE41_01160, partial [Roseiflexaceae bacterium]|nr:hypothetical protein [Roseiflexaceae bacterium]